MIVSTCSASRHPYQLSTTICLRSTIGSMFLAYAVGAHKGEQVRELIEGRGGELLFPTALLSGPQSHRGGVIEDKGAVAQGGGGPHPRGADRGAGSDDLGGHGSGSTRFLRALRLPSSGSTAMTNAVTVVGWSGKVKRLCL